MKYRKKPVVIEAVQWFRGDDPYAGTVIRDEHGNHHHVDIQTMEGVMRCDHMDWIIKGVNGEFYPCKPDIFKKTYEPA